MFRPEDAGAVQAIIRCSTRDEVKFYGSLVLARLGFRDALVCLAALASGRTLFSAGWKRYSYLSRAGTFDLLKPLTTSDTNDLDEWCAWVQSHKESLRWDLERSRFDLV